MDESGLTESDICTKFILPAVKRAGWDEMLQVREEVYFTEGRIIVRGKLVTRGKAKKADFVLYYKPNIPIALIEAKDNPHSVGDGMQQGLDYAATLDIPFVFSSNGDGFVFHDRNGQSATIETNLRLDAFPSPADLWARYRAWKGLDAQAEQIVLQDYFDDGSGRAPRYYQVNAVNAAIEAIAKGRDRVLLVMATGTGKTYTAFPIIWRLWKAGSKERILFLADRNVLIDQTMVNDFRPFGAAMAELSTNAKTIGRQDGTTVDLTLALDNKRRIDTAFEIYLGLHQAITGPEERRKLYHEFSPGFFDLIVIDECHRGSAAADSAWREILDHFPGATQIGLTATPKETEYVSNTDYFGEPVFTYSLRQGINDGFLAPHKVIKVHIDRDVEGYRPELGKNLDPFDLICHVAFDKKPLTCRERAENVKKRDVFTKYGPQARAVLDALLEKYRDEGVLNLEDTNVLRIAPFSGMGSVVQLIKALGGKEGFEKGTPTKETWFYEHRVPEGQKAYSMTKPIRLEASLTATTRRRLLDALLTEALAPVDARDIFVDASPDAKPVSTFAGDASEAGE